MDRSTEAACLLRTGAMYPDRLGFRGEAGDDVFAGVKSGGYSLYFGDEPIYHFDLEGRWQRAFVEGVHYLKGLDGAVRAVDRPREGGSLVLRRRVLGPAESAGLDATIRSAALDLIARVEGGRGEVLPPPPTARAIDRAGFRDLLDRAAAWDAAAWEAHRGRYAATYGPWPFLPPDCPNPVVLQATAAPAFGVPRPPGRVARSPEGFREHARDVASLLGRRLGQCRDSFLAGGDWPRGPIDELVAHLRALADVFPAGVPGRGRTDLVHAFLDDFRPPLPDREGWRLLASRGLGRVTLGVESGDLGIRSAFGKSWVDGMLRATVEDLKAAGIGVGLVALVGAGGRGAARTHVEATAELLGTLGLGAGDLVSLVDARGLDGPAGGPDPLAGEEVAGQVAALKGGWAAAGPSNGPRVVAYNPAKQWA